MQGISVARIEHPSRPVGVTRGPGGCAGGTFGMLKMTWVIMKPLPLPSRRFKLMVPAYGASQSGWDCDAP